MLNFSLLLCLFLLCVTSVLRVLQWQSNIVEAKTYIFEQRWHCRSKICASIRLILTDQKNLQQANTAFRARSPAEPTPSKVKGAVCSRATEGDVFLSFWSCLELELTKCSSLALCFLLPSVRSIGAGAGQTECASAETKVLAPSRNATRTYPQVMPRRHRRLMHQSR